MSDQYDAISKAHDATEFAQSRFGQHFINQLGVVRDSHIDKARTARRQGDDRMALSELDRADETDGWLGYFAQAKQITMSQKLMGNVRENLKRKEKPSK